MSTVRTSTVRTSTVAAPSRAGSAVLRATPWVAGAWALTFACLAALALLDRAPHPWSPSPATALGALTAVQVSWLIAGTAGLVLAAGIVGATARTPGSLRVSGWLLVGLGIVVTVAVSDVRALSFLGYLPMTLLALIGVGPAAGHIDLGLLTNSAAALGHLVGGVAVATSGVLVLSWAATLNGDRPSWGRWVRWGRPAVAVAAVVPLLYAVTRIAWALDVPLGVRREMLDELGSARYAGLGLALFAVVGAWLTTGLLARWGEVFWSWVPRVGGRPVPVAAAVVPGLIVAGATTSAGLSFWRLVLVGELSRLPGATDDWAAWAPELLWPVWGVALAVACLAYLGRRSA